MKRAFRFYMTFMLVASACCLSFGQQFFGDTQPYDNQVAESTSEIYKDVTPIDVNQFDFYGTISNDSVDFTEPDMGVDGPGNPGDAPIDDWLFVLPIAALLIGFYTFIRKRQIATT